DARAVIAARGGYGCMRLLNDLHVIAESASPKWVVGYSDVTALQLALYRHLGWCSLSAPVVTEWATLSPAAPPADGWGADAVQEGPAGSRNLDAAACFQRVATYDEASKLPLAENLPVLQDGSNGRGPLLGGNLSVLTRLIGTPFLPDLTGAVLILEDVGEAPYRIDRMLTHLDLAGHLDRLAGVVLGSFQPGDIPEPSLSIHEVFAAHFSGRSYPVATGLAYGHLLPRLTLPLGASAELTVEDDTANLRVELHRAGKADKEPVAKPTA
ncbi:S66 peptidase family protein, partial [Longibacter sp.]|uniref:S66 peptidase family protein n=1 Tax=Longibacter sp. TaxID=2045415 RepID=UPI003EBD4B4D